MVASGPTTRLSTLASHAATPLSSSRQDAPSTNQPRVNDLRNDVEERHRYKGKLWLTYLGKNLFSNKQPKSKEQAQAHDEIHNSPTSSPALICPKSTP
ncbi:hypothetical protein C4D60_Mb04t18460 [Musa balbisiana]|uniref:Uncharacterized protein n=1 Tax=Musa balbisiana TaxID=52838 RepID=A0A4S8KCZ6_MUSBA|nr:hypothetical protein C4D60_Mb04t18460 [Musa balbisiana]